MLVLVSNMTIIFIGGNSDLGPVHMGRSYLG